MTVNEIAIAVAKQMTEFKKEEEKKEKIALEEKVKKQNIKYPFQMASIKRTKKVLGVDAKLFMPTEKENVSPLELHSGFSRFELTIVDKESDITPTANIPAEDIRYILETSRIALNQILLGKSSTNTSTKVSLAYTQKLIDKNFKGLTPAEVLLKDPTKEEQLLNAKKWLEQNVTKYPANKTQITAIEEAIRLLHENNLSSENVETSMSNIEVYKTDYKFKSKKNDKGYNLIYGIEILCDPTKNYPFIISIMNCYAPVETESTGQKTIKMNLAEDTIKSQLMVTKDEWIKMITKMNRVLEMFENMQFETLFEMAQIAGKY